MLTVYDYQFILAYNVFDNPSACDSVCDKILDSEELPKTKISPLSKECYTEISYYFGIGPIEEIVRKRREKFVNGYVASDNCGCRLLYRRC